MATVVAAAVLPLYACCVCVSKFVRRLLMEEGHMYIHIYTKDEAGPANFARCFYYSYMLMLLVLVAAFVIKMSGAILKQLLVLFSLLRRLLSFTALILVFC